MKCSKCGAEVNRLYNGVCLKCLNIEAMHDESEREFEAYESDDSFGKSDNPITIDDMRRLMEMLDEQAEKDIKKKERKKNGIELAKEKLGVTTDEEWNRVKPVLDNLLLKYAKEMCNCTYDIMTMDKFTSLNDKRLILVENYYGIAVYYRDEE